MSNVQLRIEGNADRLIFADSKELANYLRAILSDVSPEGLKKTEHLPLVEFYCDQGSVVYKDYSELPNQDIKVKGITLVKIANTIHRKGEEPTR